MLNLGSKNSPISQIFSIPSNLQNHRWVLRQEHFLDLHLIVYIKNGQITTSIPVVILTLLRRGQMDGITMKKLIDDTSNVK